MIKHLLTSVFFVGFTFYCYSQGGIQDTSANYKTHFVAQPKPTTPFNIQTSQDFNSSYVSVNYKNRFNTIPFESPELNFIPDGLNLFAGDINGDGKDDMIGAYSDFRIADERTQTNDDFTFKTLVFFGGNTSADYDQLLYSVLKPVGDLNADGFDDAIGRNRDSTINYYFGSASGYQRDEASFTDTLSTSITGFKDFNRDGFQDLLSFDGNRRSNQFQIIFGAPTSSGFQGRTYTRNEDSHFIGTTLDGDVVTELRFDHESNIIEVLNLEFGTDDLLESVKNTNTLSFDLPRQVGVSIPIRVVDTNGDGMEEIYLVNVVQGPNVNISLFLNASIEGHTSYTSLHLFPSGNPWNPIGDINGDDRTDYATEQGNNTLVFAYGPEEFPSPPGRLMSQVPIAFGDFTPSYEINTADPGNRSYGIGDFNGDGRDDFSVLLDSDTQFGQRVFFGNTGGNLDDSQDFVYQKSEFGRIFDFKESVNIGDMNNDGIEDIAMLYTDRTDIFYGGTFKQAPDISIPTRGDQNSTIEVGDFNGDGLVDLIIQSLSFTDNPTIRSGFNLQIDFFYGSSNFSSTPVKTITSRSLGNDSFRSGAFGITNIGDFNSDGKDDIAMTYLTLGQIYIFYGGDNISSMPDLILQDFTSDYGITGLSRSAFSFGYFIQGVGDINGDDIDDFAFGDFNRTFDFEGTPRFNRGAVLLFYGSEHSPGELSSREPDDVLVLDHAQFENYSGFGNQITSGDFNGDGHNDLFVATRNTPRVTDVSSPTEGKDGFFIYHGGPDFDTDYDQLFGLPAEIFNISGVTQINANLGEIISVPDINGDGTNEILFASALNGSNTPNTHAVLVYGAESIKNEDLPSIQFLAPNPSVGLGFEHNFINIEYSSAVGDFDGDGTLEVILSQPQDPNYRNEPIYIFPITESPIVTSLENNLLENNVNLYPNPTTDQVTISLKNMALNQFKSISLTSAEGSVIETVNLNPNQEEVTLSLASLPEGLYLILIRSEKGFFTKRLMRQK